MSSSEANRTPNIIVGGLLMRYVGELGLRGKGAIVQGLGVCRHGEVYQIPESLRNNLPEDEWMSVEVEPSRGRARSSKSTKKVKVHNGTKATRVLRHR